MLSWTEVTEKLLWDQVTNLAIISSHISKHQWAHAGAMILHCIKCVDCILVDSERDSGALSELHLTFTDVCNGFLKPYVIKMIRVFIWLMTLQKQHGTFFALTMT